ncbi:MAG TPA: ATP-binding protein [Candidatus Eisenbacteria bacterium]|nr:ATP-binding protein [Candidatus Eisenbacteria bacterium]
MKTMKPRPGEVGADFPWKQVLTSLEDGVITVDLRGAVVFFNEAAEILTEVSARRALQQPFGLLFRRDPWLIELLRKSGPPAHESVRGEGDLSSRHGRKVPVAVTASPLQDGAGSFLGNVLLLRNLSYRKELEEDRKRADRLAMVGTIAAGLAHEIRNPLGGIKGAAQMLRRALAENSPLAPYTEIMVREVDRVNRLIEQLLDLNRPVRLDFAPLNIHEILEHVLMVEDQATERQNKTVVKRFDPSLPPIRGDKARLTQVFLNLVKNAFEAMPEGGALTITTRIEHDFHIRAAGDNRSRLIWVDVEDQGRGIGEEVLPHIFSPYFTTKNSGNGLGLAVCYGIIKEHGGLIRVRNREGGGAIFSVSLIVAD